MNSKPLPQIQSFLKELKRKNSAGKKQTLQEFHAAGAEYRRSTRAVSTSGTRWWTSLLLAVRSTWLAVAS